MVPKEPQLVVWCPWGRARPQSSHLVAVCRLSTNQPTTLPPNRSARPHRALQLSARHLSGVSDSVWPKLDSSFPLVLLSSWFLVAQDERAKIQAPVGPICLPWSRCSCLCCPLQTPSVAAGRPCALSLQCPSSPQWEPYN